jgi:hypothetical protein
MINPIRTPYFARLRKSFGRAPIRTEEAMRAAIVQEFWQNWDDFIASEIIISYVSEPDATGFPV